MAVWRVKVSDKDNLEIKSCHIFQHFLSAIFSANVIRFQFDKQNKSCFVFVIFLRPTMAFVWATEAPAENLRHLEN